MICYAVKGPGRDQTAALPPQREREGAGLIPGTTREAGIQQDLPHHRVRPVACIPPDRGLLPRSKRTARRVVCKSLMSLGCGYAGRSGEVKECRLEPGCFVG